MRRRTLLLGTSAALCFEGCARAGTGIDASALPVAPAVADAATGPSVAVVEYQGNSFRFDETTGRDLGDYVDPAGRFHQRCVLVEHDRLPLRVYFRPDRDSNRTEAVFELGALGSPASPANLDTYRVAIERGGYRVHAADIPRHFWFARWRWQSAPRPVREKVEDLVAARLVPRYDASELGRYSRDNRPHAYRPMSLAGIDPAMGATGERPDIGPVTGWQADYICCGTNLATMMAQAEASGTIPWHFRDLRSGGPLDVFAYPRASTYAANVAAPFIPTTHCSIEEVPISADSGHQPALNYLPFLLTGDPYYLEELQFQVTANIVNLPPPYRFAQKGRYLAWTLRTAGQAARITPASVPAWLKPRSYFQQILEAYRAWVMSCADDTADPVHAVLRSISSGGSQSGPGSPAGSYFSPWQDSFLSFVIGWLVWMGHSQWRDALTWAIGSDIQRTNGSSGWPRSHPTPYVVNFEPGCQLAAELGADETAVQVDRPAGFPMGRFAISVDAEQMLVTAGQGTASWTVERGHNGTRRATHRKGRAVYGPKFSSWAECAAANLAAHPAEFPRMPDDSTGMDRLYTAATGATYAAYTRGALAMAARLDIPGAPASFLWLDRQMRAALSPRYQIDRKWMVV
jgi:hypothetical protein